MGELTRDEVVAIAREIAREEAKRAFESELKDERSMFRFVLNDALFSFSQKLLTDIASNINIKFDQLTLALNAKIEKLVAPLAERTEDAMQTKQDDEAEERFKQKWWVRIQIAGGILGIMVAIFVLIGGAYAFFKWIKVQ